MLKNEQLDYCRVKKISDKGFGFLTSLYYDENVFFHFNMVKNLKVKEKLEKMKRGDVYFYFTSRLKNDKRRVDKLWLEISDVDRNMIPKFVERIVEEFVSGKTNPFEVAYVIKQLRENNYLDREYFHKLLESKRLLKNPSILKAFLKDDEKDKLEKVEELIEQVEENKINNSEWIELILNLIN